MWHFWRRSRWIATPTSISGPIPHLPETDSTTGGITGLRPGGCAGQGIQSRHGSAARAESGIAAADLERQPLGARAAMRCDCPALRRKPKSQPHGNGCRRRSAIVAQRNDGSAQDPPRRDLGRHRGGQRRVFESTAGRQWLERRPTQSPAARQCVSRCRRRGRKCRRRRRPCRCRSPRRCRPPPLRSAAARPVELAVARARSRPRRPRWQPRCRRPPRLALLLHRLLGSRFRSGRLSARAAARGGPDGESDTTDYGVGAGNTVIVQAGRNPGTLCRLVRESVSGTCAL